MGGGTGASGVAGMDVTFTPRAAGSSARERKKAVLRTSPVSPMTLTLT